MKSVVKRLLPGPLLGVASASRTLAEGLLAIATDELRFRKHYSKMGRCSDCQQLQARLIFHAHSLEKGLSHSEVRLGFGAAALTALAKVMQTYVDGGCDRNGMAYQNALSVLKAYSDLHKSRGFNTDYLEELFGVFLADALASESGVGGTIEVSRVDKAENRSKDFASLFRGRTSVRKFEDSDVDPALIEEVVTIALKSPSICNRQSYRVRILTDPELIAEVLHFQGGMRGYPTPPVLIVVTTDIRAFLSPTERHQTYVDGGIFAMSLLLSLEYVALAACPLNTMFARQQEKGMRNLLDIKHENFIMFIAVGNFRESVLEPKSFRFSTEQIVL